MLAFNRLLIRYWSKIRVAITTRMARVVWNCIEFLRTTTNAAISSTLPKRDRSMSNRCNFCREFYPRLLMRDWCQITKTSAIDTSRTTLPEAYTPPLSQRFAEAGSPSSPSSTPLISSISSIVATHFRQYSGSSLPKHYWQLPSLGKYISAHSSKQTCSLAS